MVKTVNCHHNFRQREHHLGRDVWLTRKGAIKAGVGDEGVIPGSMGTRSYIVRGRGAAASFSSCAHGAGRRMSRARARRELTVDSLSSVMEGRAWNSDQGEGAVGRASVVVQVDRPGMADQEDLVEVEHLPQVFNYKGT